MRLTGRTLSPAILSFAVVMLLGSFLFFFRLGDRSFRNPDEGRYAEIAREMVMRNDWIEPQLYGMDYLRKPVLFHWFVALSFKCFGLSEFSARLVPACFGILGIAATFLFTRKVFGPPSAFFASLMLLSNVWYVQVGRYLLIDSMFVFFLVSAFYLFYLGLTSKSHERRYFALFYVCLAFSFLAKGLAGVAIPVFCLTLYLAATRQLKKGLSRMSLGWGVVIFALIALPWFLLVSRREPEFLDFFFLHEHLNRFVSKNFEHQESWYFYLLILPAIFLPWILFLQPLRKGFDFSTEERFSSPKVYLALVSAGILLFYSLSRSKLATYILPCIPLICVWLGHVWAQWRDIVENSPPSLVTRRLIQGFMVLMGFFIFSTFFFPAVFRKISDYSMAYFRIIAFAAILILLLALRLLKARRTEAVFYWVVLLTASATFFFIPVLEKENARYTTRDFAETLRPVLRTGDHVFIYGDAGAFYDFGFYLGYPARLVGLEGELKLDESDPDHGESMAAVVSSEQFMDFLKEPGVYCLIRKSDYLAFPDQVRRNLKILRQNERKVLFGTSEISPRVVS